MQRDQREYMVQIDFRVGFFLPPPPRYTLPKKAKQNKTHTCHPCHGDECVLGSGLARGELGLCPLGREGGDPAEDGTEEDVDHRSRADLEEHVDAKAVEPAHEAVHVEEGEWEPEDGERDEDVVVRDRVGPPKRVILLANLLFHAVSKRNQAVERDEDERKVEGLHREGEHEIRRSPPRRRARLRNALVKGSHALGDGNVVGVGIVDRVVGDVVPLVCCKAAERSLKW